MKTNEEMQNTNRMAFKMDDGSKICIDKININETDKYIVTIPWLVPGITKDDTILLKNILFLDDKISFHLILQKNLLLRRVYFNNNGDLDVCIESYSPNKEEYTYGKEFILNISSINEISTDLYMFNKMMDDKIINGSVDNLSKYKLYYPQLSLVKKPCKKRIKTV